MTAEETPREYRQREELIGRTIALEDTGVVPFMVLNGAFPAKTHGLTCEDVMYDYDRTMEAYIDTTLSLQPAAHDNPFPARFYGRLLEIGDFRALKWPGHGVSVTSGIQFLETEFMKEEDYSEFLFDPSDYIVRRLWPRLFGKFEGLAKLGPLHNIYAHQGFGDLAAFADPEVLQSLEALTAVAREAQIMIKGAVEYSRRLKQLGFPPQFGAITQAPFDTLSDYFRGTKGAMMDMYRRPDEVLEAVEKLLPIMIRRGLTAKKRGTPRVFIPLHKGLDGFMSPAQFERFFWPSLKQLLMALVENGVTPFCFWEGNCVSRLETIADVPPGKVVHWFERTDIARAKEVLSGVACVRGGVPVSLLVAGTPEDVSRHCRKLIETVGRGGGYILDASTVLDDARPENVMAMAESVREVLG